MTIFKEAHQFNGVFASPEAIAMADSGRFDAETSWKLRQPPPYDNKVSVKFEDGTMFDVQDNGRRQYLTLPMEHASMCQHVLVGDWVCQLASSGRFIRLTNEEYTAIVKNGGA